MPDSVSVPLILSSNPTTTNANANPNLNPNPNLTLSYLTRYAMHFPILHVAVIWTEAEPKEQKTMTEIHYQGLVFC